MLNRRSIVAGLITALVGVGEQLLAARIKSVALYYPTLHFFPSARSFPAELTSLEPSEVPLFALPLVKSRSCSTVASDSYDRDRMSSCELVVEVQASIFSRTS